MRTSPTGPMPATGWSWSSEFIACMATVSPMPALRRPPSPCRADALARTVPSFPHHRKRTRRMPRSSTVSSELVGGHARWIWSGSCSSPAAGPVRWAISLIA